MSARRILFRVVYAPLLIVGVLGFVGMLVLFAAAFLFALPMLGFTRLEEWSKR